MFNDNEIMTVGVGSTLLSLSSATTTEIVFEAYTQTLHRKTFIATFFSFWARHSFFSILFDSNQVLVRETKGLAID